MNRIQRDPAGLLAFSILELMVASAVFLILLLALLAMTTGTNSLTNLASRNIDGSAKLRAVMERLATDFEFAVVNSNTPIFVSSAGSNSELHFLTRVDGYDGERPLAVVRYRVRRETNHRGHGRPVYLLERAAEGVTMVDPTLKSTNPAHAGSDYDTLADGIFRFVVDFINRNGELLTPDSSGEIQWANVGAVIVSVAAVDDRAGAITPNEEWTEILPGRDISLWQQQLNSLDFAQLPLEAARGIHIRRRVIPIPRKDGL